MRCHHARQRSPGRAGQRDRADPRTRRPAVRDRPVRGAVHRRPRSGRADRVPRRGGSAGRNPRHPGPDRHAVRPTRPGDRAPRDCRPNEGLDDRGRPAHRCGDAQRHRRAGGAGRSDGGTGTGGPGRRRLVGRGGCPSAGVDRAGRDVGTAQRWRALGFRIRRRPAACRGPLPDSPTMRGRRCPT